MTELLLIALILTGFQPRTFVRRLVKLAFLVLSPQPSSPSVSAGSYYTPAGWGPRPPLLR